MLKDIISEFKFNLNKLSYSVVKLRQFSFVLPTGWAIIYWFKFGFFLSPNFVLPPVLFLVIGFFVPLWLKPFFWLWMVLSLAFGAVVSRFVLTVLFFVVLWPINVIAKLFGVKFIDRSFRHQKASYWQDVSVNSGSLEQPF